MARFSIVPYTFRILNRDPDNAGYIRLSDWAGIDFLDIVEEFVNSEPVGDNETQKLLRYREFDRQDRVIDGIIESGEWGYEAELIDSGSMEPSHTRTTFEAELLPFYALFSLPEEADEGFLFLQRFQQFGTKTALSAALQERVKQVDPNLLLHLNTVVPQRVWDSLLEGRVTAVRYISTHLSTDISDAYATGEHEEVEGSMELKIKAKRKGALPVIERLRAIVAGQSSEASFKELVEFDSDSVKVEIDLGGSPKTVDLGDLTKLRPSVDITPTIVVGDDGHPTRDSIRELAVEILGELEAELHGDDDGA
jgi:hypothetical protein